MKIRRVKSVMVPLYEYSTINEENSLYEAIYALNDAKKTMKQNDYKHKALLVYEKTGKYIIGKISQLDIIIALESRYRKSIAKNHYAGSGLSRFGLSPDYLKSIRSEHDLWDQPLESLIQNAELLKVKDFLYTPSSGEFVSEETALADAMHQFIIGRHQSLIVMNTAGDITGILRLVDIFTEVCDLVIKKNNP